MFLMYISINTQFHIERDSLHEPYIINTKSKNKLSANLQNLTQRSMHQKLNLSNYFPNLLIFGEEMINMKQK